MESIIKSIERLAVDEQLLKSCRIQLLTCDDIANLRSGIEIAFIRKKIDIGEFNFHFYFYLINNYSV